MWGMFQDQGSSPQLVRTFTMFPGHLSDSVNVFNPNPWPIVMSWEAAGSPFLAPSLAAVGAWATEIATASHSGSGGDATVETDENIWGLPNGAGGSFGYITYEYVVS